MFYKTRMDNTFMILFHHLLKHFKPRLLCSASGVCGVVKARECLYADL